MNWDKHFWRSLFSEPDGTGSMSRALLALALTVSLGWITAIVAVHLRQRVEPVVTKDLLDGMKDYVLVAWGPYGVNKVTTVVGNIFAPTPTTNPPNGQ